ncbi:hypothetical protein [Thalassoglobus polymorphus]|uniref:Lipid/polyisoprenoid-binding YceI-like domain-containing protein n=1 Tax=Thalassoglobus polymorphus TaxID=2527994 RepID=A0A517QJH3_9PLAN|nr:hypothetical protein [Thalassoglobus polymorphus]QDT31789.1 hypothetical protein Mal48_10250 [Thalassoglobus polymorphus]
MKFSIAILTLSAIFTSASGLVEAQEKTPDYYPFKVGTKWRYQVDSGNGNKIPIINEVAEIEKIDDQSLARIETSVNGKLAATEHMSQTKQGLFRNRFNGAKVSPPIQLLKFPIKKGEKWESETSIAGQQISVKCAVDLEEIEVAAGKFKAVKVIVDASQAGGGISTTYWFADNVGIVKQTVDINGQKVVIDLEKMEPPKE